MLESCGLSDLAAALTAAQCYGVVELLGYARGALDTDALGGLAYREARAKLVARLRRKGGLPAC